MTVSQTDWAALQAAWIEWVEAASGFCAYWRDDRLPFNTEEAHFLLHIQSISHRGRIGEGTYAFDSTNDTLTPTSCRLMDIILEVSCVAYQQCPGTLAQQYMSTMVNRTSLGGFKQALCDAGLGLINHGAITSVPFQHDGREWSQATMEFTFSAKDFFQDTDMTVDYIRSLCSGVDTSGVLPPQDFGSALTTNNGATLTTEDGDFLFGTV